MPGLRDLHFVWVDLLDWLGWLAGWLWLARLVVLAAVLGGYWATYSSMDCMVMPNLVLLEGITIELHSV